MKSLNSNHFVIRNGVFERSSMEEHIKWCVRTVLSMQKGELISAPHIGADLMDLMFRRDSPKLRDEIRSRIHESLTSCENRIEVEETDIVPDEAEPELLSVFIKYRIKETKRQETIKVLL